MFFQEKVQNVFLLKFSRSKICSDSFSYAVQFIFIGKGKENSIIEQRMVKVTKNGFFSSFEGGLSFSKSQRTSKFRKL